MKIRTLLLLGIVCLLVSCNPYTHGGAKYIYKHVDPDGANSTIEVESARNVGETEFEFDPTTGKIRVVTRGFQQGSSAVEKALDVIDVLVGNLLKVAK